jgi:dihydroorotate dehydrogenase (fumarate)
MTWERVDEGLTDDEAPPGPGQVVFSGPEPEGPVDLTTRYLGLELRSPLVASSSPLTRHLPSLRAMDGAGIGAVVLPSLFEEQIEHETRQLASFARLGADANAEAPSGYTAPDRRQLDGYNHGTIRYLRLIREAKDALSIPVIASLNGVTRGGWTRYAQMVADAGADALELNVYRVAADADVGGRQVELETLGLVEAVVAAAGVPVAVKLSPYWSALGNFAPQLVEAGAAGLVLFNRFYQPDVDLETLRVSPHLVLSSSDELRLPLRWCAILRGRVDASLALTSGVHTGTDLTKALLAGADVAMTTSALLRHGPEHAGVLLADLERWLTDRGYASVTELTGAASQANVADPAAFERANYLETLTAYADTFLT